MKLNARRNFITSAVCLVLIQMWACFAFPAAITQRVSVLDPFEAPWPAMLDDVPLNPSRDYLVFMFAPPSIPMDVRNTETFRKFLVAAFLRGRDPGLAGHMAVAWQCQGHRGLIGVQSHMDVGLKRMIFQGWGGTAVLSAYESGKVVGKAVSHWEEGALRADKGHIVAAEVSEAGCKSTLAFITKYLTAPNHPEQMYGFLLRPGKLEGSSCISFGVELGKQAGLFNAVVPTITSTVSLNQSAFGWQNQNTPGVVPYTGAGHPANNVTVPLTRMIFGGLDQGPIVARADLLDPELIFAMFDGVRSVAGLNMGWHLERMHAIPNAKIPVAYQAGVNWARGFKSIRKGTPGKLPYIILEN